MQLLVWSDAYSVQVSQCFLSTDVTLHSLRCIIIDGTNIALSINAWDHIVHHHAYQTCLHCECCILQNISSARV